MTMLVRWILDSRMTLGSYTLGVMILMVLQGHAGFLISQVVCWGRIGCSQF